MIDNNFNDITFILTLKDRFEFTKRWVNNNIFPDYNYLIADGSVGEENGDLFKRLKLNNLVYIHFGVDDNIDKYLNKIYNSIKLVNSKYVMLCDNDDFLNKEGIKHCIKALENNTDYTCSGGSIYSVFESGKNNNLYNLPIPFLNNTKLHNIENKYDAFINVRRKYSYVYYSVYRKEALEDIWSNIISLGVKDLFLVEMLCNDLALCLGKYFDIGRNHYVRLMNNNSSGANSFGEFYHKKIFFDSSYRDQVTKINNFYSNLYNKPINDIEEAQTFFYLWYFNNKPRIESNIYRKFHGLLIKFPFFGIKSCIKALNIFYSLSKKFNV